MRENEEQLGPKMTFKTKYTNNEKDRINNLRNPTLNLRLDDDTHSILIGWGELLQEQQRGTVLKKLVKFANDVALGENPALSYSRLFKKDLDFSSHLVLNLIEKTNKVPQEKGNL